MDFTSFIVVASNDINESVIIKLNNAGHKIDVLGIGTNLVTCQAQPALGMVYKLVEMNGIPKIKLSEDIEKVLIPGRKKVYWIYTETGPEFDMMLNQEEPNLLKGTIKAYNPFTKAMTQIEAFRVELLTQVLFD